MFFGAGFDRGSMQPITSGDLICRTSRLPHVHLQPARSRHCGRGDEAADPDRTTRVPSKPQRTTSRIPRRRVIRDNRTRRSPLLGTTSISFSPERRDGRPRPPAWPVCTLAALRLRLAAARRSSCSHDRPATPAEPGVRFRVERAPKCAFSGLRRSAARNDLTARTCMRARADRLPARLRACSCSAHAHPPWWRRSRRSSSAARPISLAVNTEPKRSDLAEALVEKLTCRRRRGGDAFTALGSEATFFAPLGWRGAPFGATT
mgnify:CR=1 FL=1